jgi:hypothetical protein
MKKNPRILDVRLVIWDDDKGLVVELADPAVAAQIDSDDHTTNGVWVGGSPKKGVR